MTLTATLKRSAIGLVFISAVAIAQSADGDPRNFWLLNNTGRVIEQAYVSPHNFWVWGDDFLGDEEVLDDGVGALVTFNSHRPTSCIFDFRLIFLNGGVQDYVEGTNICRIRAVQFNRQAAISF